jgi:hypothetical protein
MLFQDIGCGLRRRRVPLGIAGLMLIVAALAVAIPAAAQIMIGIGRGGGGIGIGGIGLGVPLMQESPPPRAVSSGGHRAHKTKSARHSSDDSDRHARHAHNNSDRHARHAHNKSHGDSDSSSRGAGADETSFPNR